MPPWAQTEWDRFKDWYETITTSAFRSQIFIARERPVSPPPITIIFFLRFGIQFYPG